MTPIYETFFGEPWPSEICAALTQGPTPVGTPCELCDEAIEDGDCGSWIGTVVVEDGERRGGWGPVHRECILMQVTGAPGHLLGDCSCVGGKRPAYGSYRETAKWLWRLWSRRQNAIAN